MESMACLNIPHEVSFLTAVQWRSTVELHFVSCDEAFSTKQTGTNEAEIPYQTVDRIK